MNYYVLLFFGVVFNVTAQLLLKSGMKKMGPLAMNSMGASLVYGMIKNHLLWLGLLSYGVGFVAYLVVLSRFELSTAYPVASASILFLITTISIVFLGESISLLKLVGLVLCLLGIIMVLYRA